MSGIGKRFLDAGYEKTKSLLRVDGKEIIEYVAEMFPGNNEFIFVCNEEHLRDTNMRRVLERIKPDGKIIGIERKKKGPVYVVSRIFDLIKDEEDVMISYCDYYMEWDFKKFVEEVRNSDYDGAVPSYIGFHPHLLHKKYYAGVLADEKKVMTDIKEKYCFTESLMDSYQSAGAYYFRRGDELKKYFQELMDKDINLNDEYYVSMVYYLYLRDKKKIYVPEVKKFMQWGTPEDLEEFEAWSRYFAKELNRGKKITDIPAIREDKVVIPYSEDSEEFKKSYQYWREYFISK